MSKKGESPFGSNTVISPASAAQGDAIYSLNVIYASAEQRQWGLAMATSRSRL